MLPAPFPGVKDENGSVISLVASQSPLGSLYQKVSELKEHNYLQLSDSSSIGSSDISSFSENNACNLNLSATELRLGLPGSPYTEEKSCLSLQIMGNVDEKLLFPLVPSRDGIGAQNHVISGNKRGFCDTIDGFSDAKTSVRFDQKWAVHEGGTELESSESVGPEKFMLNTLLAPRPLVTKLDTSINESLDPPSLATHGKKLGHASASRNNSNAPLSSKEQVVGWPPIRSFRKNTFTTITKNGGEEARKHTNTTLFVKVSMDGAPYLRKIDLKSYSSYHELSAALETMFSGFTIGQYDASGGVGRSRLNESKLRDLLQVSEYVLTYEDRDGDWMLVGDVPWEMFIESCKRLKIMRSCDANGLAPPSREKCNARA